MTNPTKQSLRRWIRAQKNTLLPSQRMALSQDLCAQILLHPQWKEADTVLLYHALPDEVDTTLLLQEAQKIGKHIILPVVVGNELVLRLYTGETRLGAFSIEEPTGPVFTRTESLPLAIIPGMAFDTQGNRLGRGKGYYDRLLPQLPHTYLIGLCFPFQLVESIPHELHDVCMHEVIYASS